MSNFGDMFSTWMKTVDTKPVEPSKPAKPTVVESSDPSSFTDPSSFASGSTSGSPKKVESPPKIEPSKPVVESPKPVIETPKPVAKPVEPSKPAIAEVAKRQVQNQSQNQAMAVEKSQQPSNQTPEASQPQFEFDRYFLSWLRSINAGIVISSYKTHKVFTLGVLNHEGSDKLSMWLSQFNRPMGIHASSDEIWVSSSGNLWKFRNGEREQTDPNLGKFDRVYIPSKAYFSNDIDAHDICVDDQGKPYYCSALFGCVCEPSDTHSFKVYWKPPWLSKVAPEDRCHLNGICARDGRPRYISAVCQGNVKGAWREQRVGKGVICDMLTNEIVCEGMSMPHSPRWHDGKLWVLEAGTGYLGYVDFETKKFVQKVFITGYLRGLAFVDHYALIGSSEDRHEQCFQGLPLGDQLTKEGVSAKCGMFVVDLKTYDVPHHIVFKSPINELYDICVLPGCSRPKISEVGDDNNLREYKVDYNNFF